MKTMTEEFIKAKGESLGIINCPEGNSGEWYTLDDKMEPNNHSGRGREGVLI